MKKLGKIKKEMNANDLAVMVQKGFLGLEEKIEKEIKGVRKEIRELRGEVTLGVKDTKFKLGRRVHIFDHKDLEYRVEKLEEKVGTGRKK